MSGRYPNAGPARARPRRRPADRRARRLGPLRGGAGRRVARRPRLEPLPQRHPARGRPHADGEGARDGARRAARARHRGARELRREHAALSARGGESFCPRASGSRSFRLASGTATRSSLPAAPGCKRDLRIVQPYIRDFKPVLVGVDGGADALIEAGYKPRRDRRRHGLGLGRGARSAAPSSSSTPIPTGGAPGRERIDRLGLPSVGRAVAGDQRGRGNPARPREGRRADRRGRHAFQPDRVPRAEPRRDVVDLLDAAQGGGEARSTRAASRASSAAARGSGRCSSSSSEGSARSSRPWPFRPTSSASSSFSRSGCSRSSACERGGGAGPARFPGRTSGRSSPSRTTFRTGGRATPVSSPTGAASRRDARWTVVRAAGRG